MSDYNQENMAVHAELIADMLMPILRKSESKKISLEGSYILTTHNPEHTGY